MPSYFHRRVQFKNPLLYLFTLLAAISVTGQLRYLNKGLAFFDALQARSIGQGRGEEQAAAARAVVHTARGKHCVQSAAPAPPTLLSQ
jgi:hypothetical protein